MSASVLDFLKNEFPGNDVEYFQLLLTGIEQLSSGTLFTSDENLFHQLAKDQTGNWHAYFNKREVYYRDVFQVWPTIFLYTIDRKIAITGSFEDYIEIYRKSGFGLFLLNTKTLSALYDGLISDWDNCYLNWIKGNRRIISPYTPLAKKELENAIRKATNQVIVDPEKYHGDQIEFSQLIKRHYQLALTEQKS